MADQGQRPTPFDLSLAAIADERLGPLREALAAAGVNPWDRDAFLMARPVVELLRELRPEAGLGEAMDEFVAFVHAAYLYWQEGCHVRTLDRSSVADLIDAPSPNPTDGAGQAAWYVQFPGRMVWGAAVEGSPAEPLDGCFLVGHGPSLEAVAVFGMHESRDGFTVVAVGGPRPVGLTREDATPLFSPTLPGGAAAGLHSVAGMEELLELAWRCAVEYPA